MTATTPGRHRAPDPDVDPVAVAVEALRAFASGEPLGEDTARALLSCWRHLDTLTRSQAEDVIAIVTDGFYRRAYGVDQRTAVTR